MFCLPTSQQIHCQEDDGPNAFDLTWQNYLPSPQLFSCIPSFFNRQSQPVLLDDSSTNSSLSPVYYNDFYQDSAHDSKCVPDNNGNQQKRHDRQNRSGAKRSRQRKNPRYQTYQPETYGDTGNEFDQLQGKSDQDYHKAASGGCYHQQMEPIAHGIYFDNHQGIVYMDDDRLIKMGDQHSTLQNASLPEHIVAAWAAQAILNEELGNLTEKLESIRQNMISIGTSTITSKPHDVKIPCDNSDCDSETSTLHTKCTDHSESFITSMDK